MADATRGANPTTQNLFRRGSQQSIGLDRSHPPTRWTSEPPARILCCDRARLGRSSFGSRMNAERRDRSLDGPRDRRRKGWGATALGTPDRVGPVGTRYATVTLLEHGYAVLGDGRGMERADDDRTRSARLAAGGTLYAVLSTLPGAPRSEHALEFARTRSDPPRPETFATMLSAPRRKPLRHPSGAARPAPVRPARLPPDRTVTPPAHPAQRRERHAKPAPRGQPRAFRPSASPSGS